MLTIHHLEQSRSHRIVWLAEELGVDYELKTYARDADSKLAPAALTRLHPLGKAPIITHDDRVIAESAVIIDYLIDTFGNGKRDVQLKPAHGSDAYWDYQYWLHFAEGTYMPNSFAQLLFKKITEKPVPFFIRPITKTVSKAINQAVLAPNQVKLTEFIEQHLSQHKWFAGEVFSGADIQMSFIALVMHERSDLPCEHVARFLDAIRMRPAFQRAEAKGVTFTLPDV